MSLKAILKNAHDKTHELLLLKYINGKVKEERERCAKIVKKWIVKNPDDLHSYGWDGSGVAEEILKEIMEQG